MQKVKIVNTSKPVSTRGTLRLWARIQIERSPEWDSHAYKRLTLLTVHGVPIEDDKKSYIAEFKDLNPCFADLSIHYEFTIKQFG
jgi:hypothetical protein